MQTKMLATAPHWIDRSLFTNQILTEEMMAKQVEIIIENVHQYLKQDRHIPESQKYNLTVNLYRCADNPHLYHLCVDINAFSVEFSLQAGGFLKTEDLGAAGGFQNPIEYAATGHIPPVGPTPPAPLGSTLFVTIGDQFELVHTRFSGSSGLARELLGRNIKEFNV